MRTERFLTNRRGALVAVLPLLALVAGCPQEVPYAAPDSGAPAAEQPSTEAPAFTPEDSSAGAPTTSEPFSSEPTPETAPPVAEGSDRLPWETAEKKPATPPDEAGELFSGLDKPAGKPLDKPAAAAPLAKQEPAGKSDDGQGAADDAFGDFLNDALTPAEQSAAPPQPEIAESPSPTTPPDAADVAASDTPAQEDDAWWQDASAAPSADAPAADAPAVDTAGDDAAADDAKSTEPTVETPTAQEPPAAKTPTAAATTDSQLLDELWGDDSADSTDPRPEPEPELAPTPTAEPVSQEPLEKPAPNQEEAAPPAAEPSAPADTPSLFDEPKPAPLTESPTQPAAERPALERPAPLAADAMKPLPAVPVLEFNTRHLAWLLGGKLGLAGLADLDGATPSEVAEWRREVARLSQALKIADPSPASGAGTADERVQELLAAASRAGAELTRTHSADHAALLEIALKTNALLVVAKDHPDLAASVGRAVEGAAERAMLPKFLWEDQVRVLKSNPDAQQTHDAVVRLHERVESFLR